VFSNDLSLRYKNISVEPYGEITVDEGVPEAEATTGNLKRDSTQVPAFRTNHK